MEINDFYIKSAKKQFLDSIKATLAHHIKSGPFIGFIRSSDTDDGQNPPYPTASFHAFSALLNSLDQQDLDYSELIEFLNENDVFSKNVKSYDDYKSLIIKEAIEFSNPKDIYKYLKTSQNKDFRTIILFEQILSVISQIKNDNPLFKWDFPYTSLIKEVNKDKNASKKFFFPETGRSPWFLLSLFNCREYSKAIYEKDVVFEGDEDDCIIPIDSKKLSLLIDSHLNYHMARHNVKELSFDPISLTIAVCCKIKITPNFKYTPFFISCLKAIIECQYNDGRMPTGATISFNKTGDVIQQASIQIATYLAESIVDYKFLVDYNESVEKILDIIVPSFRKLAGYMSSTYEITSQTKGWSSDRLKIKDYTETWITAYACRFFHKYWMVEKAYARIKALKYLSVTHFIYDKKNDKENNRYWNDELIEVDSVLTPKDTLNKIIQPLIDQRNKNEILVLPNKDNLSFIICGPPGSGKTYIVECMAKTIGWPLVELSPSQFIKNGLDFIESTSKEIFDAIYNLNHAVVFFDECDELFRERKDLDSSNRTILHFLTASMLPKLQKLHKKRNVIFVVGTNFLNTMDKAIKRNGRFDYRLIYDRPDATIRKNFYLLKKYNISADEIEHKATSEQLEEASKFVERTITVYTQDLKKYIENKNTVHIDYDYIAWCKDTAKFELNATDYTPEQKKQKNDQWNGLVSKYDNEKNNGTEK